MAKKSVEKLVEKQTEYKPTATDGDNDGIVQDGTVFERKEHTHIVQLGDTWITISELYRGTKSNYKYAQELITKNGDKLKNGAIINL